MNAKVIGKIIICLLLFTGLAVFLNGLNSSRDVVTYLNPPVQRSETVKHVGAAVSLTDFFVKFGQVANRVDVSFTVLNKTQSNIKNVAIYCTMYDDDGKKWSDGKWNFFSAIPAGSIVELNKTDKRYISHRAISRNTKCEVVDFLLLQKQNFTKVPQEHEKKDSAANH